VTVDDTIHKNICTSIHNVAQWVIHNVAQLVIDNVAQWVTVECLEMVRYYGLLLCTGFAFSVGCILVNITWSGTVQLCCHHVTLLPSLYIPWLMS